MTIKVWDYKPLIELAKQGKSASQIIETLGLPVGVRQVQRITAPYRNVKHCRTCRCSGVEKTVS